MVLLVTACRREAVVNLDSWLTTTDGRIDKIPTSKILANYREFLQMLVNYKNKVSIPEALPNG
jgi:hypothetical protein